MGCMKCGRDVREDQIFCDSCLEEMEKYPVKMNAPVMIPSRKSEQNNRKNPARRKLPPEEQIKRLRKLNRILSFLLALALTLVFFLGYISVLHFMEEERFLPGQNYSTIEILPG